MKKYIIAFICLLQSGFAFADLLSAYQIKTILQSGAGISSKEANKIIEKLANEYGADSTGRLRISGVLTGSRWNYALFMDRKIWNLDASFATTDGKVMTVRKLFKTEVFNGGFKFKVLSRDFLAIFLPEGATLENVHGLKTDRGAALAPQYIAGLTLGGVTSDIGVIYIAGGSLGIAGGLFTFPKLKFKINPKYLK